MMTIRFLRNKKEKKNPMRAIILLRNKKFSKFDESN